MKKLLARMFFTDNCAKGALFFLTVLTIGIFLWFSCFFIIAMVLGTLPPLPLFRLCIIGLVLIPLYALVLGLCALARLIRLLWRRRTIRPLWRLLPAAVLLAAGGIGFARAFPPLAVIPDPFDNHYTPPFSDLLPLPSACWAAVFLLSLVLLLAGGLMLVSVFAAAEEKKFRAAFGKATLTLWGMLALGYFCFLGLALYESSEVAAVRRAIEQRFGRPLTLAGIEALYRESGPADADFWKRHGERYDALEKIRIPIDEETGTEAPDDPSEQMEEVEKEKREEPIFAFFLPDRPSAETLAWFGRICRENRAAIEAWETCFEQVPPRSAGEIPFSRLTIKHSPQEYPQCRNFERMERNRLILALSYGDIETAWACYRRMTHASAFLRKAPSFLGSMHWYNVERMRLDCVEKLLESRLLTDARLDELDADLADLEREIPRYHLQTMYCDAVAVQHVLKTLEEGPIEDNPETPPAGALAPYRWIFPLFWYYAALDKKLLLQKYLLPSLSFVERSPSKDIFILNGLLNSYRNFQDYVLPARTRGMRTLIRAEKYRRQHGEFPKTLDDLPEDPFTGRALIYEVGPAEIDEVVLEHPVPIFTKTVKTTVDAVQVHSDPVATLERKLRDPKHATDRTRAVIRLWNGAGKAP